MLYCQSKSKAIVYYEFPSEKIEVYTSDSTPIDISVIETSKEFNLVTQPYRFDFDGNVLTSYPYTCQAPKGVPPNASCWLISGTWDDYGTIGDYSSPTVYGQINSFSGEPIRIGSGLTIKGVVTNTIRIYCSVDVTLQWRWGGWKIRILDNANNLFEDNGSNAPTFKVACGEDCPPGYCKCDCVNYPGYCCYDNNGNPLR